MNSTPATTVRGLDAKSEMGRCRAGQAIMEGFSNVRLTLFASQN